MAQKFQKDFEGWLRSQERRSGQAHSQPQFSQPAARSRENRTWCVLCGEEGRQIQVGTDEDVFGEHLAQNHPQAFSEAAGDDKARRDIVARLLATSRTRSAPPAEPGGDAPDAAGEATTGGGGRAGSSADSRRAEPDDAGFITESAQTQQVPTTPDNRGAGAGSESPKPGHGRDSLLPPTNNTPGGGGPRSTTVIPASLVQGPNHNTKHQSPVALSSLDGTRRHRSPTSQKRHSSKSPPRRSRARPTSTSADGSPDFIPRPRSKGALWSPDSQAAPPNRVHSRHGPGGHSQSRAGRQNQAAANQSQTVDEEREHVLLKQPETRPISQEQLVAEVKGIYAGLVMVESKCIEVDNAQSSQNDITHRLTDEQWQALIALHRTLLHEHHDFFLASQHPSASPALRRLASKYCMPARMWRHGIHSFLELLRHRLPVSLEHMLAFIYLAYSMVALLYETVPTFEETWIECLGDLGRYRMAIEDDDIKDRDVWTSVSRHWYSRASDRAPTTGRLYHHLAILARPNVLQQLFYYSKSLCVPVPFLSARESILTLFDPILGVTTQPPRVQSIDAAFVRVHGVLFAQKCFDQLEPSIEEFLSQLDNHIGRNTKNWMGPGYHIGVANCCALVNWGSESNVIVRAIKPSRIDDAQDVQMDDFEGGDGPGQPFEQALSFNCRTHEIIMRRWGDPNILPYLHVVLTFMHYLTFYPVAMGYVEKRFPWKLASIMLNTLAISCHSYKRFESATFPGGEAPRPLPEDFAMRGLLWVDRYFPSSWFSVNQVDDDDEKYFEAASNSEERKYRCLWLGHQIAAHEKWLLYDADAHQFSVAPEYEAEIEDLPAMADDASAADTGPTSRPVPLHPTPSVPSWSFAGDQENAMQTDEPDLVAAP